MIWFHTGEKLLLWGRGWWGSQGSAHWSSMWSTPAGSLSSSKQHHFWERCIPCRRTCYHWRQRTGHDWSDSEHIGLQSRIQYSTPLDFPQLTLQLYRHRQACWASSATPLSSQAQKPCATKLAVVSAWWPPPSQTPSLAQLRQGQWMRYEFVVNEMYYSFLTSLIACSV